MAKAALQSGAMTIDNSCTSLPALDAALPLAVIDDRLQEGPKA